MQEPACDDGVAERAEVQPGVRGDVHGAREDRGGAGGVPQRSVRDAHVRAGPEADGPEELEPCEGGQGVVHDCHGRARQHHRPSVVLHAVRGAERHPVQGAVGEAEQLGGRRWLAERLEVLGLRCGAVGSWGW